MNQELQQYREGLANFRKEREALDRIGRTRIVESGYVREGDPHPQAILRQPTNLGRRNLFGEVR